MRSKDRGDICECFNARLKQLIGDRDAGKIAKEIGFSRKEIESWCDSKIPQIWNLIKLALFFDVTVDWLIGLENEEGERADMLEHERDIEGYMNITGRSRKCAQWEYKYKNIAFGE